jgi:hypothetical protein
LSKKKRGRGAAGIRSGTCQHVPVEGGCNPADDPAGDTELPGVSPVSPVEEEEEEVHAVSTRRHPAATTRPTYEALDVGLRVLGLGGVRRRGPSVIVTPWTV